MKNLFTLRRDAPTPENFSHSDSDSTDQRVANSKGSIDFLTVVVTAVDELAYIGDCITSILNYPFKNYLEILAVVSGDNQEIRTFLKQFPEVTILDHELTGEPGTPRNYALSQAKGKWISFIDADDVYGTHALETRLNVCQMHSSEDNFAGTAFGNERFTGAPSEAINQRRDLSQMKRIDIEHGFSCNTFNPVVGAMYRKSAIESVGGFPVLGEAEDQFLLLRLGKAGFHLYVTTDRDSGYRQVKGSRHSQNPPKVLESLLRYEAEILTYRTERMNARAYLHRGIPYSIRMTYPDVEKFHAAVMQIGPQYVHHISQRSLQEFVRAGLHGVCPTEVLEEEILRYVELVQTWGASKFAE
jgi:glycosyltransferase involved in cell wall biosynthesis